jgi:hypothetical protein
VSDYLTTAIEVAAALEQAAAEAPAARPRIRLAKAAPVSEVERRRAQRRRRRKERDARTPRVSRAAGDGSASGAGGGQPYAQQEHQSPPHEEEPAMSMYLQTAIEDASRVELPPFTLAADAVVAAPIDEYRSDPTGQTCATGPQAGATALRNELQRRFGGRGEIFNCRPVRGAKRLSLHGEGRAVDWYRNVADPAEAAEAQRILEWLLGTDAQGNEHALARRMGVQEIIWNRRIWTARRHAEGWRAYSGVNPHTDHIHIGLNWPGARMQTSHWTASAVPAAQGVPSAFALDAAQVREGLRKGRHRDAKVRWGTGPMPFLRFEDDALEALRTDLEQRWLGPAPPAPTAGAAPVGDTGGAPVASHPDWVNRFTDRLVTQVPRIRLGLPLAKNPVKNRWDDDSAAAQHLVEAYMRAWHRREIDPRVIPINVQELYARIGASSQNREAMILGGEPGGPNWCGIAGERAIGLALMRRGLRLNTGREVLKPQTTQPSRSDPKWTVWQVDAAVMFLNEVSKQGIHWISTKGGWTTKRVSSAPFERIVQRPACYSTPLKPGDYFYLMTYESPVSGHVALAIREKPLLDPAKWKEALPGTPLSELIIISGNAKGRAVRQEVVTRERSLWSIETVSKDGKQHPPTVVEFNYDATSSIGNKYDEAKAKRDAAIRPAVKARDAVLDKLAAWALQTKMKPLPNPLLTPKDGKVPMLPAAQLPRAASDKPALLREHFGNAPAWGEYEAATAAIAAASGPANATFEATVRDLRTKADKDTGLKGMPLTRSDPKWDSLNRMPEKDGKPQTGRWAPSKKGRIWVVALLRGSRFADLDNEIAQARAGGQSQDAALAAIAAKHDLDRMLKPIHDIYGDALEYWSTTST